MIHRIVFFRTFAVLKEQIMLLDYCKSLIINTIGGNNNSIIQQTKQNFPLHNPYDSAKATNYKPNLLNPKLYQMNSQIHK